MSKWVQPSLCWRTLHQQPRRFDIGRCLKQEKQVRGEIQAEVENKVGKPWTPVVRAIDATPSPAFLAEGRYKGVGRSNGE